MDEAAVYDSVTINYPVDLRLVAECVDSTQAQLQELNPSLLRLTTPREGTFELHLPPGTKGQYQTAIAEIPKDMRLWWRFHKVQPGDTVASLSRTYHMPAKSIAAANHLDGPELEAVAKVIIPIPVGKHLSDNATYARRITRYKVRRGDTVETVADNFGISPQMLRRWNGLRGDSLRGRRVLALHLPISPTSEVASANPNSTARASKPALTAAKASATKPATGNPAAQTNVVHHKVKSGDTLYSIANAYKTTVAALKRDNGDVAILKPGMILVVQPSQ
jgi:membrane-bound lytic murein transglycosylase D